MKEFTATSSSAKDAEQVVSRLALQCVTFPPKAEKPVPAQRGQASRQDPRSQRGRQPAPANAITKKGKPKSPINALQERTFWHYGIGAAPKDSQFHPKYTFTKQKRGDQEVTICTVEVNLPNGQVISHEAEGTNAQVAKRMAAQGALDKVPVIERPEKLVQYGEPIVARPNPESVHKPGLLSKFFSRFGKKT